MTNKERNEEYINDLSHYIVRGKEKNMRVYRCDRCNNIFDREPPYHVGDLYVKVFGRDRANLCDECRKSLMDWFNYPAKEQK